MSPMNVSSVLKRVAAPVAVAILVGVSVYVLSAKSQQTPAPLPLPNAGTVTEVQIADAGRTSENYQIADDAVAGDVADMPEPDLEDPAPASSDIETNATVTKVVDGDTIDVRFDIGDVARVRLLGVNTPETVDPRKPVECFGKEASAFTKGLLEGKQIRLDADPQADERDVYGRLLRNVITEDGSDVNMLLVQQGYAYAYLSFPLDPARKKQLSDVEKEAKEAKRGLWGDACRS
jgi:micrococcal nuclease